MKHRFFLSIKIPTDKQDKIAKAVSSLRLEYPSFKWIDKEDYYIKLYTYNFSSPFLRIKEQFERILFERNPFYLYARELGVFIDGKRLLYLDFFKQKELESIVQDTRTFFNNESGFKKKFTPYVVIARYRIGSKQQYFLLKKKAQRVKMDLEFMVDRLLLLKEIHTNSGIVYDEVSEFPLMNSF